MRLLGIEAHHVHFGFSPARECLRGIAVLLHPARHAEQMPWVREARRRLPRDLRKQIERFRFFFEAPAEIFPFLWGSAGRPQFHAELRELRSSLSLYRDTVVRRISGKRLFDLSEMQRARRRDWYRAGAAEYSARHPWASEMLQDFVESPAESLKHFAGMVEEFHEKVFRTAWEPINARLIADIAMRKTILGAYGVAALMRTIDSGATVRRAPGGVSIEMPQGDHELEFNARSRLTLTPSFFCWPGHAAFVLRNARGCKCTVAYAVPPLTSKIARIDASVSRACAALGDPVRLQILELLNSRELSTRELAGFLRIDEPATSRHLRVLRTAGLVRATRSGYFVMYSLCRDRLRAITLALSVLQ